MNEHTQYRLKLSGLAFLLLAALGALPALLSSHVSYLVNIIMAAVLAGIIFLFLE